MIILDTNVVSEPLKLRAEPAVIDWLDNQASESLYLTATSLSELLLGVAILPDGKRKTALAYALGSNIAGLFGSRILAFDQEAAMAFAEIVSHARTEGHAISVPDAQIAAVATVHRFTVATRDAAPFIAVGVAIINPWELAQSGNPI